MPSNCDLIQGSNDPVTSFINFFIMLFCYPVYTFLLLLFAAGLIMIFVGSKTDKDGKTSYSTPISISGFVSIVVSIVGFVYVFMKK
jgi:hypothetical protein